MPVPIKMHTTAIPTTTDVARPTNAPTAATIAPVSAMAAPTFLFLAAVMTASSRFAHALDASPRTRDIPMHCAEDWRQSQLQWPLQRLARLPCAPRSHRTPLPAPLLGLCLNQCASICFPYTHSLQTAALCPSRGGRGVRPTRAPLANSSAFLPASGLCRRWLGLSRAVLTSACPRASRTTPVPAPPSSRCRR